MMLVHVIYDRCVRCGKDIMDSADLSLDADGDPIHAACKDEDEGLSEEMTKVRIRQLLHPFLDLGTFGAPSWAINAAAALDT